MRLWTLHPQYLDAKGLGAVWREALLARQVLSNTTSGYRNHPQLERFKAVGHPEAAINQYLAGIWEEAHRRGYHFDRGKIKSNLRPVTITETSGQLLFEWRHLLSKLQRRAISRYHELKHIQQPLPHPLFCIMPGAVRSWEKGVRYDSQRTD